MFKYKLFLETAELIVNRITYSKVITGQESPAVRNTLSFRPSFPPPPTSSRKNRLEPKTSTKDKTGTGELEIAFKIT